MSSTSDNPRLHQAKKLFKQIDHNGDGTISREELFSALSNKSLLNIPTSKSTFEFLFNKIDTDKSNSISEKEFEVFVMDRYVELEEAFDHLLSKTVGKNSNTKETKTLTSSTFRQAAYESGVVLSDQDLRKIMKQLDRDGDQQVTFDEFVDALMLTPKVNPRAFFDSWFTDVFVDDGQSDYTTAREIRLVEHPFHRQKKKEQERESTKSKDKKAESTTTTAVEHHHHHHQPITFKQMVLKKLVCGGIAGCASRTLTAPVDRVRILMMTSTRRMSLLSAMKAAGSQGARGYFLGNGTNCLKVTPEMAIKLLVFDLAKQNLAKDPGNITIGERFVAGAISGLTAQLSIYPMEVVRTRMAMTTTGKPFSSIGHCAQTILKEGGVRSFYAGVVPSAVGILPYASIDLTLNSIFKDMATEHLNNQGREVSVPLLLTCGMASSSIATICTFPLNVIRTKAQATGMSVADIIKDLRTRPDQHQNCKPSSFIVFKRFYSGLLPCLTKAAPATAISYSAYEFLGKKWSY